ncbi:MAG TPA: sigma-70 family RNA polymerase sigma factor [Candidatus Polarisedimenticolia bacterium]|nr:sigma-70 family RNA polymerase sigma factor [Candidatus Polarisedimenticolia bacterium]
MAGTVGDRGEVTRLLREWRTGGREALDRLLPLVLGELRRLSRRFMRAERSGHTLQTTALVNEAYMRLVGADVPWRDRAHFFAVAARCMRRILVDHARARDSAKRGGDLIRITLDDSMPVRMTRGRIDFLALDRALEALEAQDDRKGRAVELHYFAGLTVEEIADLLDVSPSTVKNDLRFARAFLRTEMREGARDPGRR